MKLNGKKVLVVGLGRTGEAVCDFLLHQGAHVKVSEKKTKEELGEKYQVWTQRGISIETGMHNLQSFLEVDLIIPSPGVPIIPDLIEAKARGIQVISEIELAYRFLKGKIVGITGSNGKSTTTTLTHKILKEGGKDSYLAGNIGTPLISFVKNSKPEHIYVTEISSFQLEYVHMFKADISIVLNINPDHLDWHLSFDDYYTAKKKLVLSQGQNDIAILNKDDPLVWALSKEKQDHIYAFSREGKVPKGLFIKDDWIILAGEEEEKFMKTSEIPLLGPHNQENIMASALVAHVLGIPLSKVKKSIQSFEGLEHRLEKTLSINGIEFYNDSKATNVDATLKSIQSFKNKIVLILGGRDKGGDFTKLRVPIKEKTRAVILLGEATEKIKKELKNTVPLHCVSSVKEAVDTGYSLAKPGEIVLLAPACTSFDMFQNFEERGRSFKQEVRNLKEMTGKGK